MKKTVKTAMTAAMFAASLSAAAITANAASDKKTKTDPAPDIEQLMDETAETIADVYGPPPAFEETETTPDPEEPFDPSEIVPQPAYGPPSYFYDMADVNMDHSVDARDLTYMKRVLLDEGGETEIYSYHFGDLGDMNGDGVVNKEDVKALRRMLTGKSKEEEDAEEAAQTTTTMPVMTTTETTDTTTIYDIPQPDYGPIGWYE